MRKSRLSARLHTTGISMTLIFLMLSLTVSSLLVSEAVSESGSLTGAIWTTDPNGDRINGNLYTNARHVYLAGGPHKKGAAGLPDGIYYFQVTDPAGKTLLSDDDNIDNRRFNVTDGYIHNIDGGSHKWNDDDARDYGIVVQLWPFVFTPNKGGEYKVWVTRVEDYNLGQGCFGFISALSKTDNFKVKLDEVLKFFELWVTQGISGPPNVEFYVNYTSDGDGNPNTIDPVLPWTTGQLTYHRTENGYDIFRDETSFPLYRYIYWQFFISKALTWISDMHGPEQLDQSGMINKEVLFKVKGHKYNYPDNIGLEGWTIELHKDGSKIAETQTGPDGYYEFIGLGAGDYMVCEVNKTDEGWAPYNQTCHSFTADNNGLDHTFDFYNYEMLGITDTSDYRNELSSFDVVFTPSNDGTDTYKQSSTNPGSFYYNVVKYGEALKNVTVEVSLPQDPENDEPYDSPNFILHHTYIGSTPELDVHVYSARLPDGIGWVPDWSTDITNSFNITATADGKHVTVEGLMPDTGELFVTVHIDFQIAGSLTWNEVQSFKDFEYTFGATVYFSIMGVTRRMAVEQI